MNLNEPNGQPKLADGNAYEQGAEASVKAKIEVKRGTGNSVSIGAGARVRGSIIISGNGNTVELGAKCDWRGSILVKGNNQTVRFGDHSTTVDTYLLCQEGCDILIGKWCMFSRGIEVRTTDAHSVIDRETGERINKPESVVIGDHVWVGLGVVINKGVTIPNDSIVGAMAFVNRPFDEEGVIIAGAPGQIVRRGVTWSRLRKDQFSVDEMSHWRGAADED